jgi:hypothetical protein
MGTLYEWTFFLTLGLLAIVITIFVFAVSLLGKALETAAESEKKKLAERRYKNAREMAAIREKIRKAERRGQLSRGLIRQLQKELKKLEKRDEKDEKELGRIRGAPTLLTVRGGVVPCGSCLLAAAVLTGIAWYLSTIKNFNLGYSVFTWILGIAAISYTTYRIYHCLKVIEDVAIISEEATLRKQVEALKVAERELEEEKRPKLVLFFEGEEPPFHIKSGAQKKIEISVAVIQGDIARKSMAMFFAPPGFEFPKMTTWVQPKYKDIVGGYTCTEIELGDVRRGVNQPGHINIKTPSGSGRLTLYYKLTGEGFDSGYKEFEIIVE